MRSNIKVIVAHKFLLLRKALISLLENSDEIKVIGELSCGTDLNESSDLYSADVLIFHLLTTDINLLKQISKIKSLNKKLKILVISEIKGEQLYFQFYRAGVNGLITPGSTRTSLIKAIQLTASQEEFVQVSNNEIDLFNLRDKIFETFDHKAEKEKIELTHREKEVLHLVSEGLTTKEISEELNVSKRTVDHFRQVLIQKLRVNSAAGLIRSAVLLTSSML